MTIQLKPTITVLASEIDTARIDPAAALALYEKIREPVNYAVLTVWNQYHREQAAEEVLTRGDFEAEAWKAFVEALNTYDDTRKKRANFVNWTKRLVKQRLQKAVRSNGGTVYLSGRQFFVNKKEVRHSDTLYEDNHVSEDDGLEPTFKYRLFARIPIESERILKRYVLKSTWDKRRVKTIPKKNKNVQRAIRELRQEYTDQEIQEILTDYTII